MSIHFLIFNDPAVIEEMNVIILNFKRAQEAKKKYEENRKHKFDQDIPNFDLGLS